MSAKSTKSGKRSIGQAVMGGAGALAYQEAAAKHPAARQAVYRVSFVPDRAVLERARNAAFALAGPPESLTLTELLNAALRREVERLERAHNRGKAFPARSEKGLRPGRRVGGA